MGGWLQEKFKKLEKERDDAMGRVQRVRQFIVNELSEIDSAIEVLRVQGRNAIELSAERNALARVLKFLSNMG